MSTVHHDVSAFGGAEGSPGVYPPSHGSIRGEEGGMSDDEIRAAITEVARIHLGFRGELSDDAALLETLRLDSVRLLTLVAEIENRFRIILEEGDEAGIETVGGLVAVIRRRLDA